MPQHIRICALNELGPGSRRLVEINAFEEALVVHHNGHFLPFPTSVHTKAQPYNSDLLRTTSSIAPYTGGDST